MNEPKYKVGDKFLLSFSNVDPGLEKRGTLTDDYGNYEIYATFMNNYADYSQLIGIEIKGYEKEETYD